MRWVEETRVNSKVFICYSLIVQLRPDSTCWHKFFDLILNAGSAVIAVIVLVGLHASSRVQTISPALSHCQVGNIGTDYH